MEIHRGAHDEANEDSDLIQNRNIDDHRVLDSQGDR